jgi:Domain of unknown function (DUF4249)
MKKYLIVVITQMMLIGLSSCNDKNFEITLDSPEIVINSVLVAGELPRVFVGSTWSPTGKIPAKPYIENAEVWLLESNKTIGQLSYLTNGLYELANYKIGIGKTYTIKVKAMGLEANSKPVTVPLDFPLKSLQIDYNAQVSSLNGVWSKPRLLKITIKDYIAPNNSYGIAVTPYTTNYFNAGNVTPLEVSNAELDNRENSCFRRANLWRGEYSSKPLPTMIVYNDACFSSLDKELGVVVELFGAVQAPEAYNANAEELRIEMVSLSPEYFEFVKNYVIVEGLDNAFTESKRSYSNIIGGLGIVAAVNIKKQTIPVRL